MQMPKEHTLSMVDARDQLTRLPEQFEEDIANQRAPIIKVTRRNKPVLAILPWDLYESIMETLEILGDDEQMLLLRQGLLEAATEQGIPWKTAKKELGWDTDDKKQARQPDTEERIGQVGT
jgi:PHD/YefM family antitoxin component YafN of YafNO toxin-antitoxin module